MKTGRLGDMFGGWFIGDFEPTLHKTRDVEVAVKSYTAGESELAHAHKIAMEFTVVISGRVRVNEREYGAGDILIVEPNDVVRFDSLDDSVTVVVKIPGVPNDKYLVEN